MKIKDVIEIKEEYHTGHEPGLVVVLHTLLAPNPDELVGQIAQIRIPATGILELPIDEAKQHEAVNSLFFRNRVRENIPVGCEIVLVKEPASVSGKPSRSIAS
jgi:hypothetical protein